MRSFFLFCMFFVGSIFGFDAVGSLSPSVCIDSIGNVFAIWTKTSSDGSLVRYTSFPKGESWASPTTISIPKSDNSHAAISCNEAGVLFAIWKSYKITPSPKNELLVSQGSLGEGFSAPVSLIEDPLNNFLFPVLKINQSGDAIAVWRQFDMTAGNFLVQSSSLFSPSSSWSEPVTLGRNIFFSYPDLALNNNGSAATVWSQNKVSRMAGIYALADGGVWGQAEILTNLSESQGNPSPHIVLNNANSGIVGAAVWTGVSREILYVQARLLSPGDEWSEIVNLSTPGVLVSLPSIAMSEAGHIVVAWQTSSSISHWIIEAISYTPGSGWSEVHKLSSSNGQNPKVAMSSEGDAIVAWELHPSGEKSQIQVASVSPLGVFSAPVTISSPSVHSTNVAVAMNDLLDSAAVWVADNGTTNVIQGAVSVEGGAWTSASTISN